jgi:hypothetical protein
MEMKSMTSRRAPPIVSPSPVLRASPDRRAVETTDTPTKRVEHVPERMKALGEIVPSRSINDIPDWVLAGG